jgi:hypothetical protein
MSRAGLEPAMQTPLGPQPSESTSSSTGTSCCMPQPGVEPGLPEGLRILSAASLPVPLPGRVQREGIEPSRSPGHRIYSPARFHLRVYLCVD